jgi:hypothetical protein
MCPILKRNYGITRGVGRAGCLKGEGEVGAIYSLKYVRVRCPVLKPFIASALVRVPYLQDPPLCPLLGIGVCNSVNHYEIFTLYVLNSVFHTKCNHKYQRNKKLMIIPVVLFLGGDERRSHYQETAMGLCSK